MTSPRPEDLGLPSSWRFFARTAAKKARERQTDTDDEPDSKPDGEKNSYDIRHSNAQFFVTMLSNKGRYSVLVANCGVSGEITQCELVQGGQLCDEAPRFMQQVRVVAD